MAREFEILKDEYRDWLFTVKTHNFPEASINYRHVIWHALMDFTKKTDKNKEQCRGIIKKLGGSFQEKQNFVDEPQFVTLYKLDIDDGWLLIDRSRWCYPLVFDDPDRVAALGHALEDTQRSFDGIYTEITSGVEWNEGLQEKLKRFDSNCSNV